ncbi:MAG: hypothetical protein ABJD07_05735, partial [Gemmatimonadaceae bacterium]
MPARAEPATSRRAERNRILRALPPAEYEALRPRLELVALAHGAVLSEAHQPILQVYFPRSAVISL